MSINNISKLSQAVYKINNPNSPLGTLIEEIPSDIGRAREGYKRGGIIEATEKFRKEAFSAIVWIAGIPLFKKLGDFACEKFMKIPMNIDFCYGNKGNDSIKDSIEFLTHSTNPKGLDVSELTKYGDKFKGLDANSLIKKLKGAKVVTSLSALVLNCIMMGIVIPKINQKITKKKLEKIKKTQIQKPRKNEFEEYRLKTQNNNKDNKKSDISFTGVGNFFNWATYNIENNNIFRLVSTDIPMIAGRVAVSRNKYEAFENFFMDSTSSFFYNACVPLVQLGLRKTTKTSSVMPIVAEIVGKQDISKIKTAVENLDKPDCKGLAKLFDDETAKTIYQKATYGKYGKINRFVKTDDINSIDNSVVSFLNGIKNKAKNGEITEELVKKTVKSTNIKNATFLGLGLGLSILGLAVIIPKLTYYITRKLTGRNEFTGIADYSNDNEKKKNIG